MMRILSYRIRYNGCGFYRQLLPLTNMESKGFCEYDIVQWYDINKIQWADVIVIGRDWSLKILQNIVDAKTRFGKKLVYDVDDNLFSVPDWNPASVVFSRPEVKDGVSCFCKFVDMITVTHEKLIDVYSKFNKNIFVLPNFVDPVLFRKLKEYEIPKDPNEIRIGWGGSVTHHLDLLEVKDALKVIFNKYPNVKFYSFGYCPPEFKEFGDRVQMILGKKPLQYFKMLGGANLDICIAPLTNTEFNICKSNLKVLEYGAMGLPVVASNLFEYKKFINDGVDGFVANGTDEWIEKLSRLIEDEQLRKSMGNSLFNRIEKECNLMENAKKWAVVYNKLR
jgi:glycosyltransferase involved in cell wall biosynthesis